METFFTPLAIVSATVVGFLFGSVWYSPFLFMKAWMMGEGITKNTAPKHSKKYMVTLNLYSLLAHGCIASVLALIFGLLDVTSYKTAISLGLLLAFGFIISVRFIDMIYTVNGVHYEKRAQIKFLVSSGYYLCVIALMSAVLYFFA